MSVFFDFLLWKNNIQVHIGPKQFSTHEEKLTDVDLVARKFDYVCLLSHAEKGIVACRSQRPVVSN